MGKKMSNLSKMSTKKKPAQQGMVLVLALLISVVMLIFTLPMISSLSSQYRRSERSFKSTAAFNLAEGGVERAIWEMNNWLLSPWNYIETEEGTLLALTIDDFTASNGTVIGDIDISIMPPSSSGETRFLEAKGKVPFIASHTVDRRVRVNLEKYLLSIFDFGFFAHDGITAKANLFIDSYDSRDGAYGGENQGLKANAGTNNTKNQSILIMQGSSSVVNGHLASGFGTDPENIDAVIDIPDGTVFNGSRHVLPSEFEMPSVDLQNLPPRDFFESDYDFSSWYVDGELDMDTYYRGAFQSTKKETIVLTEEDSGIYSSFEVVKNSDVRIEGNVALYITDPNGATFSMENNSSLEIADGASLTLVLGNTSFYTSNNTIQNNSQIPSNLMILGTDEFTGEMNWENNIDTHAAIYVPSATVNIGGAPNINFFGAIVCNYLEFKNNINIHYDRALKDLNWIKGGVPKWTVKSWQEKRF